MSPAAPAVEIARSPPEAPEARALIGAAAAEEAARYPAEARLGLSAEALAGAGALFLIARSEGRALACAGLAPGDGWGEIERLFVAPEGRRRGLATALVGRLEDLARERGLAALRLETGTANPEALALYRRLGYAPRGPFGAYRALATPDSLFMEKRL